MLRKNDVVICDTRYWHRVFKPEESSFDPHFMLGVVESKPMKDSEFAWVDVEHGNDPWPFYENEVTKIGRL